MRRRRCDTFAVPDRFQTDRLRLRPVTPDDIDLLVALNADDEVMRHIMGRAMTDEESAQELELALGTRWLLFGSNGEGFLGWVGATPSTSNAEYAIGWRLRRSAWGEGFATEAAGELTARLFTEGAHRVFAETMAVNQRSRAVMDRIGLIYVRTFHIEFDDPLPGTDHGEVEYALTRTEWERRSNRQ